MSIAINIVGSKEAAEEVLGKTFLYICERICNKKNKVIYIKESKGYIIIAIRHRCYNYLRDTALRNSKYKNNIDMDNFLFPEKNE